MDRRGQACSARFRSAGVVRYPDAGGAHRGTETESEIPGEPGSARPRRGPISLPAVASRAIGHPMEDGRRRGGEGRVPRSAGRDMGRHDRDAARASMREDVVLERSAGPGPHGGPYRGRG